MTINGSKNVNQADNNGARGEHDANRCINHAQPQQEFIEITFSAQEYFQSIDVGSVSWSRKEQSAKN